MSEIRTYNCNLNIWYYLSESVWDKVSEVYMKMPGWLGFKEGIPRWFGEEDDPIFIEASVEPSGLAFYAHMKKDEWESWIENFKQEATKVLGFEVGEPEDGFQ
jgi:hypothetical protein